jgi:hypothetical protein
MDDPNVRVGGYPHAATRERKHGHGVLHGRPKEPREVLGLCAPIHEGTDVAQRAPATMCGDDGAFT